jgi:hypothetical protein
LFIWLSFAAAGFASHSRHGVARGRQRVRHRFVNYRSGRLPRGSSECWPGTRSECRPAY